MQWSRTLALGIGEIDCQHKELIDRLNDVLATVLQRKRISEVTAAINSLQESAIRHFNEEENYMIRSGYPGYSNHKTEHAQFLQICDNLKETLELDDSHVAKIFQTQRQVCDWLPRHICETDKKMAKYLKTEVA